MPSRLLYGAATITMAALLCAGAAMPANAADPTAKFDAKTLAPEGIVGPSQAGDVASDPELAWLTGAECAAAKARGCLRQDG